MRTRIPDKAADSRSETIVLPPRVVSKAKLRRSAIARLSRRTPSCHAAAFEASDERDESRERNRLATSSGSKGFTPRSTNTSRPMLLLPPPLVPASTNMLGAAAGRSRDDLFVADRFNEIRRAGELLFARHGRVLRGMRRMHLPLPQRPPASACDRAKRRTQR